MIKTKDVRIIEKYSELKLFVSKIACQFDIQVNLTCEEVLFANILYLNKSLKNVNIVIGLKAIELLTIPVLKFMILHEIGHVIYKKVHKYKHTQKRCLKEQFFEEIYADTFASLNASIDMNTVVANISENFTTANNFKELVTRRDKVSSILNQFANGKNKASIVINFKPFIIHKPLIFASI